MFFLLKDILGFYLLYVIRLPYGRFEILYELECSINYALLLGFAQAYFSSDIPPAVLGNSTIKQLISNYHRTNYLAAIYDSTDKVQVSEDVSPPVKQFKNSSINFIATSRTGTRRSPPLKKSLIKCKVRGRRKTPGKKSLVHSSIELIIVCFSSSLPDCWTEGRFRGRRAQLLRNYRRRRWGKWNYWTGRLGAEAEDPATNWIGEKSRCRRLVPVKNPHFRGFLPVDIRTGIFLTCFLSLQCIFF